MNWNVNVMLLGRMAGKESIRKRTATAASACKLCFLGRETVAVLCLDCPELRCVPDPWCIAMYFQQTMWYEWRDVVGTTSSDSQDPGCDEACGRMQAENK